MRFAVHGRGAWAGLQALCAEHNIGRGRICTLLKLMPRARGAPFGGISSERPDDERPWKQRRVSPPPMPQRKTLVFEANAFLTDVLPMPCDEPQGPRSALAKPGRAVAGHRHVSFDLDAVVQPTQCGAPLAEAAASDPRQAVVDVGEDEAAVEETEDSCMYIDADGIEVGPLTTEQLQEHLATGKCMPHTLVHS